jgi:DNA helicase II / ATP-dependent DNA helicase PcrA
MSQRGKTNLIEISLEDIGSIESLILPPEHKFNEDQVQVLLANKSADIVACPGSGKTTVLIAKIAIIYKKLKKRNKNEGICIFTHTNVGVEEINNSLKKVGINKLDYPNFIGTINEFFNQFISIRAYYEFFKKDINIGFLDEDDYKRHFSQTFDFYKPDRWSVNAPTSAIKNTGIVFNNDKTITLRGLESKGYRDSVLNTFINLINKGRLRHSDTFSLAEWYISNYQKLLQKAFAERFKYVFIDETQDTSIEQYKLINQIFDLEKTTVQKFGDPFQSLYNLYGNEKDAWEPNDKESIEISFSNRFGENIARILRTTCINEYKNLKANESRRSFPPHLFIYNNENKHKLLEAYSERVEYYEKLDSDFKTSNKKVSAICQHHPELKKYHPKYTKLDKMGNKISPIKNSYIYLWEILDRYVRFHDSTNERNNFHLFVKKEFPEEYQKAKINQSIWIREIKDKELDADKQQQIFTNIKVSYIKLLNELGYSTLDEDILEYEINKALATIIDLNNNHVLENEVEIDKNSFVFGNNTINLGTIHSVKGETHKATLVLESTMGYDGLGSDITDIFSFLIGEYNPDLTQVLKIRDTLKLAYVALSRPTHFVGAAINKDNLIDYKEMIRKSKDYGWIVIEIEN